MRDACCLALTAEPRHIAKALRDVGLDVQAVSYAAEVREQLLRVGGVLVWVDPVRKDGNRAKLDPILRDVASHGVFVGSHPDLSLRERPPGL